MAHLPKSVAFPAEGRREESTIDWQKYEEAASKLFEQLNAGGELRRNVSLPDRDTGRARQVDLWWEVELAPEVRIRVLVDAKFRKRPIDVREVEAVCALGNAVGADKCVVVVANGWTEPAAEKARRSGIPLKMLTVPEAMEALDVDTWRACGLCREDAIVLDQVSPPVVNDGAVVWWLGGTCWNCGVHAVECQECGGTLLVEPDTEGECRCGHAWRVSGDRLWFQARGGGQKWVPAGKLPEEDAG